MPLAPTPSSRTAEPASPPRSSRLENDLSGLAQRGTAGLAYLNALADHPTLAPLALAAGPEPFDPAAFAAQVMRDSGGSAAVSKSRYCRSNYMHGLL